MALKTSAVAYECLGFYNAAEHLMIRILKAAGREIPTGAFSHRDILKAFRAVVEERELGANDALTALETLMAFRHVAIKIYGFLIDWQKLRSVVADIRECHLRFAQMFREVAAGSSSG